MTGKQAQLNKIRSDAAECLLISSLATSDKREIFAKIAEHLNSLASEFEKTAAVDEANVTSATPPQLEKIRSDAAECLLRSNLANGDKREMFAKTAEHLNSLVFEVEKTMAANGANLPSAERHMPAVTTDLTAARDQIAVITSGAAAGHQQAARPKQTLPWLLVIVAATIAGVLFWANDRVEKYLSLLTSHSKQEQSPVTRANAKPAGTVASEPGERNVIAERLGAVAARFGSLEKVLENLKRRHTEPPGSESVGVEEKTGALTADPATARRDLEMKVALSNKSDDETAQLRKTAEAVTAELQQERQRIAALTQDLATAHRELETKAALSGNAEDEATQLRKTAEAATTKLQQERQNTALPRNAVTAAKPSIAAPESGHPATSGSKVNREAAHLVDLAKSLLSQGNIIGARIVLERAIELGSAKASFAIAETYDPRVLSHWNVYGTRGDIPKAREFYARAAAGGIEEANDRLTSLYQ